MRVLYLDIDSLRPDHLGCYGYPRSTSPNLDAIAAEGIAFERLYASDTPCVPSRACFVSGRFGIKHGAVTHWGSGSAFHYPGNGHTHFSEAPVLPRLLSRHGIRTVTFSSFADRHHAWWYLAGWSEAHQHSLQGGNEHAHEVNAAVLPWIKAHSREDNWFLHVQYWDPHRPYRYPAEWKDKVTGPLPGWPDVAAVRMHQQSTGPFSATNLFNTWGNSNPENQPAAIRCIADAQAWVRGYDGAVRYMDEHIGQLVAALKKAGVWDETAVIVSADHGEALGEQGVYGDHCCASEAVHRLPGIVRWPGAVPRELHGTRNGAYFYNLDLFATIVDLLGIEVPKGWDGRTFATAVRGKLFAGREHLVWSHALYSCQRVIRTPKWQLRRTFHPGLFCFSPLELFDMECDPHETVDVSSHHPDVVHTLLANLEAWHQEHLGRLAIVADPMQEVIRSGPWKYVQLKPWLAFLRDKGQAEFAERIEVSLHLRDT